MRKPRACRDEHTEQCAVMAWVAWNVSAHPCLKWLHAIPNGGHRNPRVAVKLKAEGVKAGVADLFLPWPVAGKCGLYIEMKAMDGDLKNNQQEFLEYAEDAGYVAAVCYGADEAIQVLEDYLAGKYEHLPFTQRFEREIQA